MCVSVHTSVSVFVHVMLYFLVLYRKYVVCSYVSVYSMLCILCLYIVHFLVCGCVLKGISISTVHTAVERGSCQTPLNPFITHPKTSKAT